MINFLKWGWGRRWRWWWVAVIDHDEDSQLQHRWLRMMQLNFDWWLGTKIGICSLENCNKLCASVFVNAAARIEKHTCRLWNWSLSELRVLSLSNIHISKTLKLKTFDFWRFSMLNCFEKIRFIRLVNISKIDFSSPYVLEHRQFCYGNVLYTHWSWKAT